MISAESSLAATELSVLSMRCIAATPCSTYDWHSHPLYEFSFVSDDNATIGYPPGMRSVGRDTLLFYHVGEHHAGWSGPIQTPRFWVVHFTAPRDVFNAFPKFSEPDPRSGFGRCGRNKPRRFAGCSCRCSTNARGRASSQPKRNPRGCACC